MDLRAGPRADEPGDDDGEDQVRNEEVEEPLESPDDQMAGGPEAPISSGRLVGERAPMPTGRETERQLRLRWSEKGDEPAPFDPEIMDQLPVRRNEEGEKTHGVLSSSDGRREGLVSGYEGPWRQLPQQHKRISDRLAIVSHVEAHAAAHMWLEGIEEATLHLNNPPCGGRMGCDVNLPNMLPPDAKLTVWFPGPAGPAHRVFRGPPVEIPKPTA
jgi:SCP1.201-like deaminase